MPKCKTCNDKGRIDVKVQEECDYCGGDREITRSEEIRVYQNYESSCLYNEPLFDTYTRLWSEPCSSCNGSGVRIINKKQLCNCDLGRKQKQFRRIIYSIYAILFIALITGVILIEEFIKENMWNILLYLILGYFALAVVGSIIVIITDFLKVKRNK